MEMLKSGYKIIRIVITGGPCSGKSSALDRALSELEGEGYHILLMPETATQLISNGISPDVCGSMPAYQRIQIPMQLAKEQIYDMAAEKISEVLQKPILVLYDRGLMDNKAYMEDEDFLLALAESGLSEEECLARYDAVFHLETAAKGARDAYTCANNSARSESPEEAVIVDNHSLHAWEDHPARTIIDNSTGFEEKMQRLFDGIKECLA